MFFSSNDGGLIINKMQQVTPTEFESGESSEFTINISPLAGWSEAHNQSQIMGVLWCKIKVATVFFQIKFS